ncbi:DUF3310 domain-containing protein [Turicimonas muris]|uniref:DUF3310 domain-containing protein n=1 Tax=Turicimonas muris TaxID=1796652 RepID=UPI0026155A42|nr:DUF3310 domain-containing protein [Turicimonas muris]
MPEDNVDLPRCYILEADLKYVDVIKVLVSDLKGYEEYAVANIIHHILRWKRENGIEDLIKADQYINDLINYLVNIDSKNDNREIFTVYNEE